MPPTTTTMPIAAPVSVSTIGTMIWASQVARSWAWRLSSTFSSNSWRLTASRPMPWTVRTPWMPSASAPFRVELVIRARRNAPLARGIQMIRTITRIGTTESVSRPSRQSSTSSTKVMPTSSTKSPIANTEVSRNSCKACTSPCRRDIRRPTSVLSMNDSETRCRCAYIARRRSISSRSAIRPTRVSWIRLATKLKLTMPKKTRAPRVSSSSLRAFGTSASSITLRTISGIEIWLAENTRTASTASTRRAR